jgi:hypothetical protein
MRSFELFQRHSGVPQTANDGMTASPYAAPNPTTRPDHSKVAFHD